MQHEPLDRWYRAFHGRAPSPVSQRVALPRELADLGELVAVTYRRPEGDLREHPFAPSARPMLARDERGRLHVLGGHFTVNERGITDMHNAMTLHDPRTNYTDPRAGYTDPRTRFTPQGVAVHGLATPPEGLAVVRHNPVDAVLGGLRAVGARAGEVTVVVGTAITTAEVTDAIVDRLPFSEGWRAVIQVGGTLLPGAVAMPAFPAMGTGFIAGGAVAAVRRVVRSRGWDQAATRWLESLMPARRTAAGADDDELPFNVKIEASAQ